MKATKLFTAIVAWGMMVCNSWAQLDVSNVGGLGPAGGGSLIRFLSGNDMTAIQENFGINLFGDGQHPVRIRGGNLMVGYDHTDNPVGQSNVHVNGGIQIFDDNYLTIGNHTNSNSNKGIHFTGFRDTQPNYFGASIEGSASWQCCNGFPNGGYPGVKYINLDFYVHDGFDSTYGKKLAMRIAADGNIGIGTESPAEKLAVNGNVRAKEVKVETSNWPDYVFEEGYKLPNLAELSNYIKQHRHLPGMPAAKEAEAEGIALGEMNRLLLEKVEELTLLYLKTTAELKNELAKQAVEISRINKDAIINQ